MKYNVHVYTMVRVTVENVEAACQEDAVKKAIDEVDFNEIFDMRLPLGYGAKYTEWAEEDAYYLVDEVGDGEYTNSKWWKPGKNSTIVPM